eukprot:3743974-Karenia_brevis.AAC.1
MEIVRQGDFCVRTDVVSGKRMRGKQTAPYVIWACPKYDGQMYDRQLLAALPKVMLENPMNREALQTLGIVKSDHTIDHNRILEISRQYTVVISDHDRVQEVHKDFIIHGETEHARWAEHVRGFQNHAQIQHARPE